MQWLVGADAGTGMRGHVGGAGGGSAVQPHSMGGVRGERRDTHTHTHTHTQAHTRELCTYSLVTDPLKSARPLQKAPK